jgi:hypothetical protein
LHQPDKAKADLSNAIEYARKADQKRPQYWRNNFNLSLYQLATGNVQESEQLVREALAQGAPIYRIREALDDHNIFLRLFPNHDQAIIQINLLKKYLETEEK